MRFYSRLLRTLLGRNLRHVDLAIRTGTNIPLFYSLAFGQLTRLVPGDSLTSRALRTAFLRFLRSFPFVIRAWRPRRPYASHVLFEGFLSAMSRSRVASQYFVAIFRDLSTLIPFCSLSLLYTDHLYLNEKKSYI